MRTLALGTLLALLVAGTAHGAVSLLSALPSRGRATDIRDTSAVPAGSGRLTLFQSLSYRFADQKFDGRGKTANLGLNQTITLLSATTSLAYGASDRLSIGFTISPVNQIRRKIALTNFAAGASLLGQTLPVGQSTTLLQQGNGTGDLTLNSQLQVSDAGDALTRHVSLDVTIPTASPDQSAPLDLAIGQGNYSVTPSASLGFRDGPWSHFLKAGYELTTEAAAIAEGKREVFKAGEGVNLTLGSAYRVHGGVTARAFVSGFQRGRRVANGAEQADSSFRNVELRPGVTAIGTRVNWSLDTFVPLSGANVLRTTGLFLTAEVRF